MSSSKLSSLSPGPQTFTAELVREVLDDSAFVREPGTTGVPLEFFCPGTSEGRQPGLIIHYSEKQRQERAVEWCKSYQQAVWKPEGHFHRIDALFSDILQFHPLVYEPDLTILRGLLPKSTRRLMRPLGESLLTDTLFQETLVKGVLPATIETAYDSTSYFYPDPPHAQETAGHECLSFSSEANNIPNGEVILEQSKQSQSVHISEENRRKFWLLNSRRSSRSSFRKSVPLGPSHSWGRLQVATKVSTNLIRLAIQIILSGNKNYSDSFRDYVDTIAELLEVVTRHLQINSGTKTEGSWLIVQAFLWASWQRSMMLYYWSQLHEQIKLGGYYHGNREIVLRAVPSVSFDRRDADKTYSSEKALYMCNLAYRLLWRDRASVGQDFRRFHEVYRELFGNRPARCVINEPSNQCNGMAPESCQRFKGATIVNQSVHDVSCLRSMCTPLFWDRKSYKSVQGARAVCLDNTDDKLLRYRPSSGKTLAISHVWSRGQGGRPEADGGSGFNSSLHQRYASIAHAAGCDSYWMDTPCIPTDHQLRHEAIANINMVFNESMLTLICDRDLMDIDLAIDTPHNQMTTTTGEATDGDTQSIRLKEAVLAALLVCDWNVRAWTFLEAMRGKRNVHVLCKNNKILSVKDTVQTVLFNGHIDLAILLLTSHHLLPGRKGYPSYEYTSWNHPLGCDRDDGIIEDATCQLNYRHASRQGDDIVIWSLLCNTQVYKSAEAFWKSRIGTILHTGFLLSSAPRLQNCPGFGWAPSRPAIQLQDGAKLYAATDGNGSENGLITARGFNAKWLVFKWDASVTTIRLKAWIRMPSFRKVAMRYLCRFQSIALLQPLHNESSYMPAYRRDGSDGPLYALVTSADGKSWMLQGVYEWVTSDRLPKFYKENILLV